MITNIDYFLFVFFNTAFSNPFFDTVFPIITKESNLNNTFFAALGIYLGVSIIFSKDKIGAVKRVAIALLLFVISDSIAHHILKEFFQRLRPCNSIYFVDGVHVMFPQCHFLLGQRGSFSFPSNHAVNLSALALIWSLWYPKAKYVLISIALLLIYTRVYCGVHYPLDLFFGIIFGCTFGYLAYIGTKRLFTKKISCSE